MENLNMWQLMIAMLSVAGMLAAPTIWLIRQNSARLERDHEKYISKIETASTSSAVNIREDLKELRNHLDVRLSDVYRALESKNIEMKQFVATELEFIRSHIASIESKLDQTREKSHEIEKDLLKLQNKIGRDYITKEDLDHIVKRHQM